jgi:hypothetical protein
MSLLLHFTTTEKLKLILHNGIRFGNMTNTNDIFEKSDLIDEIQLDKQISDMEFSYVDRELISKVNYKDFYKLLCFTLVDGCSEPSNIKYFINKPIMWANYADNYQGACLILDKNKFEKSLNEKLNPDRFFHKKIQYDLPQSVIERFFHGEVDKNSDIYKSLIIDLRKDYIRKITKKLNIAFKQCDDERIKNIYKDEEILFYKHHDWQYENEYRYVCEVEKQSNIYIDIKESIKYIVFSNPNDIYNKNLKLIETFDAIYQDKSYLLDWINGFPNIVKY